MVAFLNKSEGSEDFHQIIDFLNLSHIKYALTENPTIYTSLIQQFWETASASTSENEEMEITATIDGRVKTITEASIRRHLKLEDSDGIPTLPNAEIFEQLALMGYASDSDKLTFQKGHFSPQWRFLIHTILHCLSPKKTAWEQFSSNIATAIICLATNRTFNFSFHKVKTSKSRRRARVIISDNEGRSSADTKILLEQEEPTELVEDPSSGEKGEKEISTAERKDKGKAIMKDDESVQKKTKKQLEKERHGQEQEKYDLAQALELQKELDKRKEGVAETTQAHDIDWSNPDMLIYHAKQNKSFSKAEIGEVSESVEEQSTGKEKEVAEEELKKLLIKKLIEGIIRVGNHTEVYQVFKDILKRFDRDDLEKLWDLVKKKFSSTKPIINKEKVLWVELKRLFEPDDDDTLWKASMISCMDPLNGKLF
ncbi:hypothetical protein Tco_0702729 [Tanacetum coccineum]|uniref:Uncharacterized protein n=1 Tax=Tanacetum coccineum TaxID=301880 RepID=A0ABQ4XYQ9_9ASTR